MADWINPNKSVEGITPELLIDDDFTLLIDEDFNLLIDEQTTGTVWSNPQKS